MQTFRHTMAWGSVLLLSVMLAACGGDSGDDGGNGPGAPNSHLDPSFGSGGKVTTAFGLDVDGIFAALVQADGKVVVAGHSINGGMDDFALARYDTNGALDLSFGANGKVTTDFGANELGYAAALQADGKIVVAGESFVVDAFALARYNSDGSLDTTFDTDGKVTTQITGDLDSAFAVAVQGDGKIVAAGMSFDSVTLTDFTVARYNTDGSLDTNFNTTGIVTTDINGDFDGATALVIQSDGKIVVAGFSFNGADDDFCLVRYNADGSLDSGFGAGGIVTTDFSNRADGAISMAQQADGKLVVTGGSSGVSDQVFALARYHTNGSLDSGFGTGGRVTTNIGGNVEQPAAMVLQADGKVLVAGMTDVTNSDFALVRYNADGSVDTGFGAAGIVTTNFGSDDYALALVLQPDGKTVAAGVSNNDFALARYIP